MTAPGKPQSAEEAYREAQEACPCRRAMSGLNAGEFSASPCWRLRKKICRCGTQEPNKPHIVCIWEGHAALDAALRALLAERGHVAKCQCHPAGPCTPRCILNHPRYDDNRCARPAWLPESR